MLPQILKTGEIAWIVAKLSRSGNMDVWDIKQKRTENQWLVLTVCCFDCDSICQLAWGCVIYQTDERCWWVLGRPSPHALPIPQPCRALLFCRATLVSNFCFWMFFKIVYYVWTFMLLVPCGHIALVEDRKLHFMKQYQLINKGKSQLEDGHFTTN